MRWDALRLPAIVDAKDPASRSQLGGSKLNGRPREAQSEEWETFLFFAAISSPALFFIVREVFDILGR